MFLSYHLLVHTPATAFSASFLYRQEETEVIGLCQFSKQGFQGTKLLKGVCANVCETPPILCGGNPGQH